MAALAKWGRSGTPAPAVQDATANNGDDSPTDRIEDDHAEQQECEHHQWSAALTVAVKPRDRHLGNSEEKCNGEQDSAGVGEPEPVTEPGPIAMQYRHASSLCSRGVRLGQTTANREERPSLAGDATAAVPTDAPHAAGAPATAAERSHDLRSLSRAR